MLKGYGCISAIPFFMLNLKSLEMGAVYFFQDGAG